MRPEQVLLVDNVPKCLIDMAATIQAVGLDPLQVDPQDPVASAKALWQESNSYIAIVDLSLPDPSSGKLTESPMIGFDLIRWLHDMRPDSLIVALTGMMLPEDEQKAQERGAAVCYQKGDPWHTDFLRRVREHQENRMDDHVSNRVRVDDFDRALSDESYLRSHGGQVIAIYLGRLVGAGESYAEAAAAVQGVANGPSVEDVTFVPLPYLVARPGSEFAWCLDNAEIQTKYAGLVAAVASSQVWGAGNTRVEALRAAQGQPGCPDEGALTFVIVPSVRTAH